jgi:uncharacterized membrane protein
MASIVTPTRATGLATAMIALIILGSAAYLWEQYASLPSELPVHFRATGLPDGWQFKTPTRVLVPVLVQIALALTLGAIGGLLLFRQSDGPGGGGDEAPDVKAAAVAAEAVILITLIWVAFQGYAAWALVQMWTAERAGLGPWYYRLEVAGGIVTVAAAIRAQWHLGRPPPRPFVAAHWRLGHLYKNPADPALFVPTRDGRRWTLNFGRPVAAALLGLILLLGIIGPTVILGLVLRGS